MQFCSWGSLETAADTTDVSAELPVTGWLPAAHEPGQHGWLDMPSQSILNGSCCQATEIAQAGHGQLVLPGLPQLHRLQCKARCYLAGSKLTTQHKIRSVKGSSCPASNARPA